MSNLWAAYSSVSRCGYHHLTFNHLENLVDLRLVAILKTLKAFGQILKLISNFKSPEIPAYLDEIMLSSDGTTEQKIDFL